MEAMRSKFGALWIQPDGPNTQVHYLGCHDLGDITASKGAQELIQCLRADGNGWDVLTTLEKPPELIKFSIDVPLFRTADWLEQVTCPATLYITMRECGRADIFSNYVRAFAMTLSRIVSEKIAGLVMREEDKLSTLSFELEARPPLVKIWKPSLARLTTAENRGINAITTCGIMQCASGCGPAQGLCEILYKAGDAGDGVGGTVYESLDSGATWAATGTRPFGATENISALICVETGNGSRLIAARGTTDGGNPAEIAYSDDGGDTWTNVNVGSVNGAYVPWHAALFAVDWQHVWVVTTDGYVYFSDDAGATWTTLASGFTEDLWAIHVNGDYGLAGGVNNALASSSDAGASWALISGPASQAGDTITQVQVIDANNWWLTYDDGRLYYTDDGGVTWTERTLVGVTPNFISDLKFGSGICGWMIVTNTTYLEAASSVLRTIDGGNTWELIADIDNSGLNSLVVCDCNTAYIVGELYDSTSMVVRASA